MHLDRVTITGPDNSISPKDLWPLSKEFPWVEWGILVSARQAGTPRFPALSWLEHLRTMAFNHRLNLSLHVCGQLVRQLLMGDIDRVLLSLIDSYQRVQLNFHAERNTCDPPAFQRALKRLGDRQFIFQLDGERGNAYMDAADQSDIDIVGLFDVSGGAGILPKKWPSSLRGYAYRGYAGGLGPANLAEQIPLIAAAAGDCRIWIDMETKVRSEDDRQFDLAKVRQCLEIARPFVEAT